MEQNVAGHVIGDNQTLRKHQENTDLIGLFEQRLRFATRGNTPTVTFHDYNGGVLINMGDTSPIQVMLKPDGTYNVNLP